MSDPTLQAQDDAAAAVATAPRVTLKHLNEAVIVMENFFTLGAAAKALGQSASPGMHLTTLCVLTLRNGFTVTGSSACASPENFDEGLGREIARRNAMDQCYFLEGYLLRERLHAGHIQNS